ncbi:sugar ABC transporter ATP-binding protein [Tessaracoccus rhinocerotis]|uniref:Sugar ABC transporter ATP-binding protein n=1 Tax=Tessaracoccus rhinocerotis TaxID=1689449 RepID=A0A553JYX9_9ACTN|nr:sugar ABC transporter ATP-binding protein [Tessaracoccus rhinocerotis]TRY17662.1 sugar ABC transporter ATP-binding protein [Tessaracoccus rhinocerotis]
MTASDNTTPPPRLSVRGISKSFAGVAALREVTFDVLPGEVLSVCGENGAGKSTLMKILSGGYQPDAGTIEMDGVEHHDLTPVQAQELGINIIHQENLLVPTMSVLENMFVGREPTMGGLFIDRRAMRAKLREESEFLGIELNPRRRVEQLSVSEQQFVKILKALVLRPRVLIMDEPTSMFNVEDANRVLNVVRRIAEAGISVIYISHFLGEVQRIADRIVVLRDGQLVSTTDNQHRDVDLGKVTNDMVGRPIEMFYTKVPHEVGEVRLSVEELRLTPMSPPVSFDLRRGEILGIAGMVGSGRTEIVRAIAGADGYATGRIVADGRELRIRNPRDAIDSGIAHITEDRQRLGLALGQSVLENTTVVGLDEVTPGWLMSVPATAARARPLLEQLRTKMAHLRQQVRYLSGGNQQKVVLAKWLLVDSDVFIFDEPTRGIDVNAKTEFYSAMTDLCQQGKSIIMVSSDMPELVSMSDRVLVVRGGAVAAVLEKDDVSEESIISHALEGR